MASEAGSDPVSQGPAQKKNKKKKPKAAPSKTNGAAADSNGVSADPSAASDASTADTDALAADTNQAVDSAPTLVTQLLDDDNDDESDNDDDDAGPSQPAISEERLEAAAKQRDELRNEVTQLRKSLESIQQRHEDELATVREQLEDAQSGKDHAEGKYQKLLGQVNTIKQQLGERLKADAEELSNARSRIEGLEQENKTIKDEHSSLESQISELTSTRENHEEEIKSLRGRTNLSQQNWAKERDAMVSKEAQLREEFEDAKQAMQDWEVLAMEERSQRETLGDRVAGLEDQLATQRDAYDKAAAERDSQSVTVDGLQRALQDIQQARKQELREVVENSQSQVEELRKQLKAAEDLSAAAQASLDATKQELERAAPFEKEVKEKNLLIGKLRHEAVILHDHLTKALRFLQKGKPEDTVDRRLITNHLLHFLALDRSDPKKFQVLQLISALLGWTDEQKESAGLARPGTSSSFNSGNGSGSSSSSSLRLPLAPFRRVSSSTSLSTSNLNTADTNPSEPRSGMASPNATSGGRNETLAELWSEFLEREAAEGGPDGHGKRRMSSKGGPMSPRTMSGLGHGRRQSSVSGALAEGIEASTRSTPVSQPEVQGGDGPA